MQNNHPRFFLKRLMSIISQKFVKKKVAKTQIKLSCLNKDSSQYQQKYGTVLDLSETQVFVSQYGTLLTLRSFSFSKQIKSIIKTIKSTTKTDLKINMQKLPTLFCFVKKMGQGRFSYFL